MSQVPLGAIQENSYEGPILSVEHLNVSFKRQRGIFRSQTSIVRAVNDVSFDVKESEIMSLVGESGSGKTTVARCILGLMPVTSGSISLRGHVYTSQREAQTVEFRRDVQMVFQDPFESMNPREDVYTTICIPLRRLANMKDEASITKRIKSLLLEVGLEPERALFKLPHQLSGGERQRVNIARALASDPKLLIADEPITMLDASQRLNVLSLLLKLKTTRNLTILMITHDLASARALSNRTAVMYQGKLVEIGPTKVLLSKPSHPYTASILSATPRLETGILGSGELEEAREDAIVSATGCIYSGRCKYATDICRTEPELLPKSGASHMAACHNPLNS
ncbi:MAG: oligopeptide/dipeptide ABC transporter ATP-binding protein [Nitrososphaerales archaeon]